MPDGSKRVVKFVAAAVSIVILASLVHLGWGELKTAWLSHRNWNWLWIGFAAVSQVCVYLSIAGIFRISLIANSQKLSFPFLIFCAFAFLFANRSLPGPAIAGLATLIYLMRQKNVSFASAQAAAASFYFADYAGFITLIAAAAAPLLINQPNHTIRTAYLISLGLIAAVSVVMILVLWKPQLLLALISAAIIKVQSLFKQTGVRDWSLAITSVVSEARRSIMRAASTPGSLLAIYSLSVIMHCCEVATVICGAKAVGIPLTIPVASASYVAGNLVSIVSVLPGALGFFEAGMIGTIHVAGHLSIGDATLCTLIYRVLSFWAPMPAVTILLIKVFRQGVDALVRPRAAE